MMVIETRPRSSTALFRVATVLVALVPLVGAAGLEGRMSTSFKFPGMHINMGRSQQSARTAAFVAPVNLVPGRLNIRPNTCDSAPRLRAAIDEAHPESTLDEDTRIFTGAQLVTYGDVFRAALSEVEDLKEGQEARKIDLVSPVARAASTVGSGVVAMLEKLISGPSEDEVDKNLEAFAMRHGGAIGLAIKERNSKTDLDRLEDLIDLDMEDQDPEHEAWGLDDDDML